MTSVAAALRWWEDLAENTSPPDSPRAPEHCLAQDNLTNIEQYLPDWNYILPTYVTESTIPTELCYEQTSRYSLSPDLGYATSISSNTENGEYWNWKIMNTNLSNTVAEPIENSSALTRSTSLQDMKNGIPHSGYFFSTYDNPPTLPLDLSSVKGLKYGSPGDEDHHNNSRTIIQIEERKEFLPSDDILSVSTVTGKSEIPESQSPRSQDYTDNIGCKININVEIVEEEDIPEDLPDLRFSRIKKTTNEKYKRAFRDNWYHFVRRRVLYISTIRKMFGVGAEEGIVLVANGRGVKNPLKSNLPSTAVPSSKNNFECGFCNGSFKTRRSLSRHLNVHTTFRQVYCTVCWKGFYDTHDLRRHSPAHSEINVFFCDLCEAIYLQNTSIDVHLNRIHEMQINQLNK